MDWTTPFVPLSQLWWNPAIRPGYSSLTQKKKQEYETKRIIDAYKKSSKTLEELLTFLDV